MLAAQVEQESTLKRDEKPGSNGEVSRLQFSGGPRSDAGPDRRDSFLGLTQTCDKGDYLRARFAIPGQPIPYLPEIVRNRCASA